MRLEGAAECQRPRDTHAAPDAARGGGFRATNQTDQRRLTGAVAAENAKILSTSESKADIAQHFPPPVSGCIHFRDVFYSKHLEFHAAARLAYKIQAYERQNEAARRHITD